MLGLKKWIKAARLPSQLYICVPLLAGQAYAYAFEGCVDLSRLVLVQLYGVAIQFYIVFANDFADVEADRINTTFTPFSGGSRVLVDGDLSRMALKRAAVIMATLSLVFGVWLSVLANTPIVVALSIGSLLLLHMYSFNPVRMNYRGGGELLQMVGTAVVLPLIGWVSQVGDLTGFPYVYLWFLMPTALACAVATSLPDQPADIGAGKNSASAVLGQRAAQLFVMALNGVGVVALYVVMGPPCGHPRVLVILLLGVPVAVQVFCYGAKPGSIRMFWFVAASILTTLGVSGLSAVASIMVSRHHVMI